MSILPTNDDLDTIQFGNVESVWRGNMAAAPNVATSSRLRTKIAMGEQAITAFPRKDHIAWHDPYSARDPQGTIRPIVASEQATSGATRWKLQRGGLIKRQLKPSMSQCEQPVQAGGALATQEAWDDVPDDAH
jgi:hypothetical protein